MIKNLLITLILTALVFLNSEAQSLDHYINLGLKNSPLLYDFSNQKLAARFDSLIVLASYKPQVNQVTQAAHYPTGSGWGYDEAITNGGKFNHRSICLTDNILRMEEPLRNSRNHSVN